MIRYLGSFRFAILLIASAATLVIAATLIESQTGSHQLAEKWVYKSPLFFLLLGGFFLNILFSALLRWPFSLRHVPFLMTHLGLLMVIAGVFIKQVYGVQGHLHLTEGEEKSNLTLPGTLSLEIIKRGETAKQFPITGALPLPISSKTLFPHGQESFLAWRQEEFISLKGVKPQAIPSDEMISLNGKSVRLLLERSEPTSKQIYGGCRFLHIYVKEKSLLVTYGNGFGNYETREIIDNLPPSSYAIYDQGFKGYTALISFKVPEVEEEENIREEIKILAWSQKILNEKPFADKLLSECPEELKLQTLISELFDLKEMLPDLPNQEEFIPLYLKLRDVKLKDNTESFEIESPLARKVEILPPQAKPEDNKHCLALQYLDGSRQLLFLNSPFKTLSPSGKELLHLTEAKMQLPFSVRLHQARDIKYPGTDTTSSYECDLSILYPNQRVKTTLSMNNVYESPDAYRLYLSGMALVDKSGVRSVQLVINRDPAKYWLTYPGGLLISLGAIGLFLPLKRLFKNL